MQEEGEANKIIVGENNFQPSVCCSIVFSLVPFCHLDYCMSGSVCCNIYIYNHLVVFSCNLTLCKHRFEASTVEAEMLGKPSSKDDPFCSMPFHCSQRLAWALHRINKKRRTGNHFSALVNWIFKSICLRRYTLRYLLGIFLFSILGMGIFIARIPRPGLRP